MFTFENFGGYEVGMVELDELICLLHSTDTPILHQHCSIQDLNLSDNPLSLIAPFKYESLISLHSISFSNTHLMPSLLVYLPGEMIGSILFAFLTVAVC
jgi:hypothetical protein